MGVDKVPDILITVFLAVIDILIWITIRGLLIGGNTVLCYICSIHGDDNIDSNRNNFASRSEAV